MFGKAKGKGAGGSKGGVGIQVAATGSLKQQREAEAGLMPERVGVPSWGTPTMPGWRRRPEQ